MIGMREGLQRMREGIRTDHSNSEKWRAKITNEISTVEHQNYSLNTRKSTDLTTKIDLIILFLVARTYSLQK